MGCLGAGSLPYPHTGGIDLQVVWVPCLPSANRCCAWPVLQSDNIRVQLQRFPGCDDRKRRTFSLIKRTPLLFWVVALYYSYTPGSPRFTAAAMPMAPSLLQHPPCQGGPRTVCRSQSSTVFGKSTPSPCGSGVQPALSLFLHSSSRCRRVPFSNSGQQRSFLCPAVSSTPTPPSLAQKPRLSYVGPAYAGARACSERPCHAPSAWMSTRTKPLQPRAAKCCAHARSYMHGTRNFASGRVVVA